MKKTLLKVLFLLFVVKSQAQIINFNQSWKFKTGDNPEWAKPDFDDSDWKPIMTEFTYEQQGYEGYNGYSWYRIKFFLPNEVRERAYLKDRIRIILGKIDDVDQIFLNGEKIGQTGSFPSDKEGYVSAWTELRKYLIPADHQAVKWNQENVVAVRVYDGTGGGGFYGGDCRFDMAGVQDYVKLNTQNTIWDMSRPDSIFKMLYINNNYEKEIRGTMQATYIDKNGRKMGIAATVKLAPKKTLDYLVRIPRIENSFVDFTFTEVKSGTQVTQTEYTPYFLTPPTPAFPKINGPKVYGARPNADFLYRIPISGEQPINVLVTGLPKGLVLDSKTGIIKGNTAKKGTYLVKIKAKNTKGEADGTLKIIIGDDICLTPPMGWNSWNCWGLSVNDERVRSSATALIEKGLAQYGWSYINIDDGWEAEKRLPNGEIATNEKFPNMKNLADFMHANGLKLGIYSSPGEKTCGGFLGSYKHEDQDAATYAKWGIDYLKYDWCSYEDIAPKNPTIDDYKKPYQVMRKSLDKTKRDIVYSLCQYGMGDVQKWGNEKSVGADLWRTTGDITESWYSMSSIGFAQDKLSPYAKPSAWNDPDMLILGWVGWGPNLHITKLTPSEQYSHVSLWSMLSAPLLLGCDLSKLDDFTLNLLTNNEVLAINQDELGIQATKVSDKDKIQVWIKDLADGSKAVAVFNLSDKDASYELDVDAFGLTNFLKRRDVWIQQDLDNSTKNVTLKIYSHGVSMLKFSK